MSILLFPSKLVYAPIAVVFLLTLFDDTRYDDRRAEQVEPIRYSEVSNNLSDTLKPVRLYFAGDCALAGYFEEFVGDSIGYPFAKLGWFAEADLSMINLENPITTRESKIRKRFNFRMPPKYLEILIKGGIDVVSLANNHIYDYGPEGLLDTIGYLDSVGIKHCGAGKDIQEARRPALFDLKGIRVGVLSYFGDGVFAAGEDRPGVAPRLESLVVRDIQELKPEHKVDFVVVNFHWGIEKATSPSTSQIRLAHRAVEAGADLIVGHHPHVIQGVERYREGVIAYSVGNFLFGGNSTKSYDTIVLRADVGSKTREYTIIPIRVENWQPYALEGAPAEEILAIVKARSRKFQKTIF